MKNLMPAYVLAILLAICLPANARALVEVKPQQVSFNAAAGNEPSAARVREIIGLTSAPRGWVVVSEQAGQLTLRNNVRGKHVVVVKVTYDGKGMQVAYVSSENMNYKLRDGTPFIHPKYDMWVGSLLSDVAGRLSFASTQAG